MDYSYHPRHRTLAGTVAGTATAITAAALLASCADTFTPAAAARADQLFDGVATRFSPNTYDARYDYARVKLAQSALVPSRIFEDSAAWTTQPTPAMRALFISGSAGANGHYRFETRTSLPPASHVGDSRHAVTLEQVAANQFRWDTRVELALGAVTADEITTTLDALLRAPEGRTERAVREDYRTAFPRSTAAFGRGFLLDSATITPSASGATSVVLRFVFHPELMKPAFPALTGYLDKYLAPAKYHFTVTDRAGTALFDIAGRDRALTIRYRVAQGKLVSLLGPVTPWPDSLTLLADVSLKVKLFTVGVRELNADFIISNSTSGSAHERAWTVVAQHEPKWDLPLITERLIRSPLRRPFEGQGSMFRLSVRDSAGGQTTFARHTRLEVQESAIMRFIGSLASRAMGDLDGRVEQDEHRFMHEGFVALQTDLRAFTQRARDEAAGTEKRR